jgi:hypothetical protein
MKYLVGRIKRRLFKRSVDSILCELYNSRVWEQLSDAEADLLYELHDRNCTD